MVIAAIAWAVSGDPVRALAVVVVATPCPLILAAPIALMSGLSRAARAGVVVKGAGTIEQLGEAMRLSYLRMFATIISTDPPPPYWQPESVTLLNECEEMRRDGDVFLMLGEQRGNQGKDISLRQLGAFQ